MIADMITVSRILFSFVLFFVPTSSCSFAVLYILCGVTDMIDGTIARKLHTESGRGARLDSAADLIFTVVYAVRIFPVLSLPLWIWIWTAGIAAFKTAGIIAASIREHRLFIQHSPGNKLTGLLIFLLPLSVKFVDVKISATIICTAASLVAIKEILEVCTTNRSK